ncbi:hypothetical protein VTK73DRAFT_1678 [Phialemonium thermophilum]|uniref:Uncharacterized protein n=1 Tax=Phialemonium thermophilum TaxID=223376 RepID=A0ABR3VTB5_9PEZI
MRAKTKAPVFSLGLCAPLDLVGLGVDAVNWPGEDVSVGVTLACDVELSRLLDWAESGLVLLLDLRLRLVPFPGAGVPVRGGRGVAEPRTGEVEADAAGVDGSDGAVVGTVVGDAWATSVVVGGRLVPGVRRLTRSPPRLVVLPSTPPLVPVWLHSAGVGPGRAGQFLAPGHGATRW